MCRGRVFTRSAERAIAMLSSLDLLAIGCFLSNPLNMHNGARPSSRDPSLGNELVLNPIVRNAVYTALQAMQHGEQDEKCQASVNYNLRMVPRYWDEPELLAGRG
jgi:hypothetical protein